MCLFKKKKSNGTTPRLEVPLTQNIHAVSIEELMKLIETTALFEDETVYCRIVISSDGGGSNPLITNTETTSCVEAANIARQRIGHIILNDNIRVKCENVSRRDFLDNQIIARFNTVWEYRLIH